MSKYDARGYYSRWKNSKLEEEEDSAVKRSSSDSSGKYDARGYLTRHKLGLDTLESDLRTMGETLSNIYGSWQTKETMDNTFESVNNMYTRLGKYQDYHTQYGKESGLPDLSELLNTYKNAVDKWGERTELYGNYQNADAFNKAVKDYQLSEKFKGLSYDRVQGLLRKYDVGTDEYNYLKNYTGYTSVEDFDKAIAGLYDGSKLLSEAKEYEGKISSYEGRAKTFEGRTRGLTNDGGFGKKADDTKAEYDAWLNGKGYSSADEFKSEMKATNDQRKALEEQKKLWMPFEEFKGIEQNADFGQKSGYVKKDVKYESAGYGSSYLIASDEDAHKYNLINGDKDAQDYESLYNVHQYGTNDDIMYEYLEPEEKQKYNYLWETQGPKKANQYADALAPFLRERRVAHEAEMDAQMAKENPFATSVVSVFDNVGNNMMALPMLAADALDGDGIDENSSLYRGRRRVNTERSTVEGMIDSDIGKFFYRHGLNTADNLATMAVSGFGKYGAVSKVIQTGIMSSGAFVDTTLDAKSRGLSDEQALTIGAIAGAAEYYFESKGFESMFGGNNLSGGAMGYFVDNLKTELVGELGTELTNDFADFLVAQDMNKWKLSIEDYVERGYSESEALSLTIKDYALKYADVAAGTLFSSGVMTAPSAIGVHSQNKAVGKDLRGAEQIGDVLNIASMTPQESEAYKAYTAYANKGVTADNITNAQLGNLYNTVKGEAQSGFMTANEDLAKAKEAIYKQKAIRESETASEAKKARATEKLDTAIAKQTDAQVKRFNSAETLSKLEGVEKSVYESGIKKAIEKAEAEKRAKHEAEVKKLSSGVETSVMADTDKAIEIKGMKDSDTLITSDGEVKLKDVELSDRDADLVAYARGMEASEASLYLEQYNGEENIEEYTNTFSLVTSMAKNNYSEDALLKAKGSLSTEQFNAIYAATVTEKYREKQRNIDKLNAEMAGKMSYKGVIDDSVINYGNKAVKGKVKWSELNSRQREAVTFISGFAKATGINLKLIADGERRGINGSYDKATNTITIDVYAGISKAKNLLKDTIIPTMSHETTHWMKEKSPELYRKIGDLVFKTLEAHDGISEVDRVALEVARHNAKGRNITDDGARDEIIARACEDMLKMSEEGKRLFNSLSESEKKTFIDKVKEILANLMEWVDNLLNSYSSDRYEAKVMREYKDTLAELSKMWDEMLVSSVQNNSSMELAGVWGNEVTSIGGRDLSEFSDAVNTDGDELFQYRAMEEDEDTYRNMLLKYKDIIGINVDDIEALFNMVDKALGIIKNNLEALDYGWDTDINDRAFMPVKPNSDSLYQVSLDFSTLCRKRLLQQTIQNTLQEALQKQLSTEEAIAIRDELMKIQEEGKKIEIACALCYVESARMKSPKQINKFLNNRDAIIREFFANRSGGSIKQMVADAEMRARQELARQHPNGYKGKNDIEVDVLTAPKKQLKTKDAQFVRDEGKKAKASYELTAKEQAELDAALELNVSDFTSADGLESLAKDHSDIFDAYVSFVRNATHSKGIEKDTWWRAGDSDLIGDTLIANMNKENGLRSQSWSDFQVIHLLDYIAATIELSTKGAKRQSYTKVPDYVKLLGNTGDMINMSLIPERVFNGKLSYDGVEGMAYEIAKQLRDEYHATAGTICIGITNDQIKMLLADKTIDMVIPYHKSSMSQATRKLMHIPTWDDYEDYQQEKSLNDSEAVAMAKKYGVELNKDKNYQKAPKFSEWFNLEEARQIAKMENENPSNTDEQQKYGIMYGGYKAMQNAANNYLKLCAERGLSPKFSHQNADFTGESNYWKLLIDRKMVDNVTGEIIEQKAIKPIFSEKSVLEILNDELERYPQIKKDNDYAASKVVKKFLSGEMKVDKSTLEALKKPVDNVAVLNILESADDAVQNDDRDSDGKALTKEQIEFFKDSKVRDENGNLRIVYHGTPNGDFTTFRLKDGTHSSLMSAYGAGYYFDSVQASAKRYAKPVNKSVSVMKPKVFKVYLNITNPLKTGPYTKTITKEQLAQIINKGNYEWFFTDWMPFTLTKRLGKTKEEIQKLSKEKIVEHWSEMTVEMASEDADILSEIVRAYKGDSILSAMKDVLGHDGVVYKDQYGEVWVAWDSNQIKSIDNKNPTASDDIRYSDRDYDAYDSTALLKESTIDTYLKDYASKSSPNYAQAYITYMSPSDFLHLTTSGISSRTRIENESTKFDKEKFVDATHFQPIQLRINHKSGEVESHEGRHRMVALMNEGIYDVPVLLFDSSNKYDKVALNDFKLIGQFNESHNVVLGEAVPLSYANRDAIIEKFGTKSSRQKMNERYRIRETLQYSDRDDDISVYEKLGELDRVLKERDILKEDIQRLHERLKLEGKVTNGKYFTDSSILNVAGFLLKKVDSKYDKVELAKRLKSLYHGMTTNTKVDSDALWNEVLEIANDIALMAKPKTVKNDYAMNLLKEIKGTRVRFNSNQKAEAKARFGANWNRSFFGKIILADDARLELDQQWQEWAEEHPDIFDAHVKDSDQPMELYDILTTLKEQSEVIEEYNKEEFVQYIATEILGATWNLKPIVTTADKYTAKIKEIRSEHKQAMKDVRDAYNARVDESRLAERMFYGKKMSEMRKEYDAKLEKQRKTDSAKMADKLAETREQHEAELYEKELAERMHFGAEIAKLRRQKDEKVAEAKELGKQKMAEYKENVAKKTKIQSITRNALDLVEKRVKNSKDMHIPEIMLGPVDALLDAINFSSKRLLDGGEPTKTDISLAKSLSKIKDMMAKANSKAADELIELYGHGLDESIEKMVENVDRIVDTIGDNEFVLNRMSLEDLQTLDKVVKTIKQAVNKLNKFHVVNHAKGIANLSQESMVYLDSLGKGKIYDGMRGKISKLLNWNNTLPYYAFKRYGEGGMAVYTAFQDGWDKFAFNVKAVMDYAESAYTNEEVKTWSKEVKEFKILVPAKASDLADDDYTPEYQTVRMTVPQIMSMYCLNKREQARGHLFKGGIRVADFKDSKGKIVSQSDGVVFTEKDVATIFDSLTDRQKAVADKLQEFMNTVCTDWGNEVSMARFGYKAFGEANYFPIQSDKNNLAVDDETEQQNSLFRLLNMSFTKSLDDKANNRIVISDIFDVFAQHSSDMAKYSALALPVLDAFKWYNYKEKQDVADGTFKTKGVKQSIENAFGKDGQSYFTTFLKDINGQQEVSRDTLGKGFFSNAKIASVGANLRVVALQPTSYVRASAVIDSRYLTRAFAHKPKIDKAEKWCGIALWKSMGYYDTNIQRGVVSQIKHDETGLDKAKEKSMKLAEMADKITWGYLWNACELEIRDKRKDLEVGSDEFYTEIGKRLREVIYATQVVDSTMTRSQMMRSSQFYDKMLTAFASEPTLSYNMLQDAYMGYSLDARRMGKAEAFKKNGKRIARTLVAYTMTNALAALVESGFDAFREDDDEEEMDLATFMKYYLTNFLSDMSITAKIPYIKEAHSVIKGFGSSRTDTQWMDSMVKAGKAWAKTFSGEGSAKSTIKYTLKAFSDLSGLPFYNVYRDPAAFLDKTEIFTSDDLNEMFEDIFN